MNPVDVAWHHAVRASAVLERVEDRLVAAGAVTELRQFYGLSASEVDVLLRQELDASTPEIVQKAQAEPQAIPQDSPPCPSSSPQTRGETVAA